MHRALGISAKWNGRKTVSILFFSGDWELFCVDWRRKLRFSLYRWDDFYI